MSRIPFAIIGIARDLEDVQALVDSATDLAEHQIRRGYAPPLWESRARYEREMQSTLPGVERVALPEEVQAMGFGDCDDLAPYAAASLRSIGVPARAVAMQSPGIGYHIFCAFKDADGNDQVWDPSAERGMLDNSRNPRIGRVRRRRSRGAKIKALVKRAAELAKQAASMHPGSMAAKALLTEALRATNQAQALQRQDARDGADSGDEGDDDE